MILIRAGGLPFAVWQSIVTDNTLASEPDAAVLEAAKMVQDSFDKTLANLADSDFRTSIYNARKAFFQKRKMPAPQLMEAIAAQKSEPHFGELLENLERWIQADNWMSRYEKEYETRLQSEWAAIQLVAADAQFQRSLLFASHDLLGRLTAFSTKPVQAFDKKDRQIALSAMQYLSRSIFKTSPLGRFTTVQLWRPGNDTHLDFYTEKVAVTPNVALLPALYEVMLREPAFFESLVLVLNPCISTEFKEGEPRSWLYFDGEQEAFQYLASNPVAELVITLMQQNNRKLAFSNLLSLLSDEVDASREPLINLIKELISLGMLEWQLPEAGLSPSWCSNLCNYLSFLPTAEVLTDAAFLLQSLRVSARAISFQAIGEAQNTQVESRRQMEAFFHKYDSVTPPIVAEQMFFEDVERTVSHECTAAAIQTFARDMSACWTANDVHALPEFRSRLFHFTRSSFEIGQVVDFQEFCKLFFESNTPFEQCFARPYQGKIGAMIQVYKDQDTHKAVVNALFPGGGKLYARWMHLFPSGFRESLEQWHDADAILFPWQGWSNANFQSIETGLRLEVPDGRVGGRTAKRTLILSDLGVRCGTEGPELLDKLSGERVFLMDLGLEAPESRPPTLQVLWHLGVPYVSSIALLPKENLWTTITEHARSRKRIEHESLVLARAAWEFLPGFFEPCYAASINQADRYRRSKQLLSATGIPRHFFARLSGKRQKPQHFDWGSPVSMLLLEKMMTAQPHLAVLIEEMLPTPDQWVLGASEKHVGEFVLEFKP